MERKKCSPFVALERQAERLFQRLADGGQGGQLGGGHARLGVAGVAGEEPGHVFRVGQRGGVEHDALEVVEEAVAVAGDQRVGLGGGLPERLFARRRGGRSRSTTGRPASSWPTQDEIAVVGDEHLTVLVPVAC